jgi:hypothetical protein
MVKINLCVEFCLWFDFWVEYWCDFIFDLLLIEINKYKLFFVNSLALLTIINEKGYVIDDVDILNWCVHDELIKII